MAERESTAQPSPPVGEGNEIAARSSNNSAQNFSTQGRSSTSQVQALRGCCNTCR